MTGQGRAYLLDDYILDDLRQATPSSSPTAADGHKGDKGVLLVPI